MIAGSKRVEAAEYYIVPARHLSGTPEEVLTQIDQLIQGLIGLRQLVSLQGPRPAEAPRQRLRLVKRFVNAVLGLALTVAAIVAVPARASATPSTTYWAPSTASCQARGVPHITYDTYFWISRTMSRCPGGRSSSSTATCSRAGASTCGPHSSTSISRFVDERSPPC